MKAIIIQEIRENGEVILHREMEDVVLKSDLDYWEKHYSRSRDPHDSCSFNSDAVVINVYEIDDGE